ncbi:MAG: zf-HC2 domain-containing protein [Phycisphaerales bacterium]
MTTPTPTPTPTPAFTRLTCADVRELLPDLLGNELDAAQIRAIESHATSCESCAKEIAESRHAAAVVRRAAVGTHAPKRSAAGVGKPAVRAGSRFFVPLALAASLALVFGLGVFAGRVSATTSLLARSGDPIAASTDSLATRYRRASTASPQTSPLGLALLSIARRH